MPDGTHWYRGGEPPLTDEPIDDWPETEGHTTPTQPENAGEHLTACHERLEAVLNEFGSASFLVCVSYVLTELSAGLLKPKKGGNV